MMARVNKWTMYSSPTTKTASEQGESKMFQKQPVLWIAAMYFGYTLGNVK